MSVIIIMKHWEKKLIRLSQQFDMYSFNIYFVPKTTKASWKHQLIFLSYVLLLFHVQPSENIRRGVCVRIFGSNITGISYYPLQRIVIQRGNCNYICANLLIVCYRSGKIAKKELNLTAFQVSDGSHMCCRCFVSWTWKQFKINNDVN